MGLQEIGYTHKEVMSVRSESQTLDCQAKYDDSLSYISDIDVHSSHFLETGRGSSIGSEFAWQASGPKFDRHVRHILSWRLGHENIPMAILPLPLIQEEQLSVTGERMCTMYW